MSGSQTLSCKCKCMLCYVKKMNESKKGRSKKRVCTKLPLPRNDQRRGDVYCSVAHVRGMAYALN